MRFRCATEMSASKSSLLPDFAKYIERQRVANDIGPPIGIVGVLLFTFGLSYFNYLNEYKSLIASKFCQPEMAVKLKLVKEGQFKNWMTGNHNLQNEVKALRELNHPNVVKMLHNETQQEIRLPFIFSHFITLDITILQSFSIVSW